MRPPWAPSTEIEENPPPPEEERRSGTLFLVRFDRRYRDARGCTSSSKPKRSRRRDPQSGWPRRHHRAEVFPVLDGGTSLFKNKGVGRILCSRGGWIDYRAVRAASINPVITGVNPINARHHAHSRRTTKRSAAWSSRSGRPFSSEDKLTFLLIYSGVLSPGATRVAQKPRAPARRISRQPSQDAKPTSVKTLRDRRRGYLRGAAVPGCATSP